MENSFRSDFAKEVDARLKTLYGDDLNRAIQVLKQDPTIKLFLTGDANAPDLPIPIKKIILYTQNGTL